MNDSKVFEAEYNATLSACIWDQQIVEKFNSLNPIGKYTHHNLRTFKKCCISFTQSVCTIYMIHKLRTITSLKHYYTIILLTVTASVFCEVQTEFLFIICIQATLQWVNSL